MIKRSGVILLSALVFAGCEDDDSGAGRGNADFVVYGEDYIEQGIPAEEFEDDWGVTFSKFLVVLGNVSVGTERAAAGQIEGTQVFNLVSAGPHDVGSIEYLDARAWDTVGYEIRAITPQTTRHSSATPEDVELVRDGGYSVYVSGTAKRDDETKTFTWGFTNSTRYSPCFWEDAGREIQGIVIKNSVTDTIQLTIHGDHFFYDDLASEDAVLRFDAFAQADTDDDGEITLEELADVKLVDVEEGTYGTGSVSDVDDLRAFVTALTRTLGHFQGEGHCTEENF